VVPRLPALGLVLACLAVDATTVKANGRSDYLLHCGGCHLENGSGNPPEVPDLRTDIDWLASTRDGRSYLTRVPGASQVPISDARLAAVMNWILRTYYPDENLTPFTATEVGQTRRLPLYDPLKAREALAEGGLAAAP